MNNRAVIQQFWPYLKRYRLSIFGAILAGLIGGFSSVYVTYQVGIAVNQIKGPHQVNFSALLALMGLLLLLYVINVISLWIINLFANHVGYFTVRDLRNAAYAHLDRLPIVYYDGHSHGDLLSRFTNDLDFVSDAIIAIFNTILSGMTIVLLSLIFMLSLSPLLTIVVFIVTILMFIVTTAVARDSQRYFGKQQLILGQITGFVTEHITNQRVVSAFSQEKQSQSDFGKINQDYQVWGQKAQFVSSLANPTTRFVDHLGYLSIGTVGGLLILHGNSAITIGLISSFIIYSSQFTAPFLSLSGVTNQIQTALAGLIRVFNILQTPIPQQLSVQKELTHAPKEIRFSQVDFAYEPDEPLIQDFNLRVHQGQTVAIVGQTGAGKTTLVNLLMRFYEINAGKITIDSEPITDFTKASYRRQFGMVLQDTWLFKGSVWDNLTFGAPQSTTAEVTAAAKAAYIETFINKLPNGYQTIIGGDEDDISSGQMQLLTIARVMLMDPPILILDEATSDLDNLTEANLQKALDTLMRGKLSFIIAHRLATIQKADIIIVMDHGHIVETGQHAELLQKKGAYYQLYQAQFAGEAV